jgi:hypothetical protein
MYSNLATDEVSLTFLTFFLIRTDGRTEDGQTLRYIEAAHCLKKIMIKKVKLYNSKQLE